MTTTVTMLQTRLGESGSLWTVGNSYAASDAFAAVLISSNLATGTLPKSRSLVPLWGQTDNTGAVTSVVDGGGKSYTEKKLTRQVHAYCGDSLFAQSDDLTGYVTTPPGGDVAESSLSNYGVVAWELAHAKADVKPVIIAVSGSTSADVVNLQLPQVLALRPDVAKLHIGVNDGAFTGGVTVANIRTFTEECVKVGIRVHLYMPSPTTSFTSTASRFAVIQDGIIALAREFAPAVRVTNAFNIISDPNAVDGTDPTLYNGAAYASLFDQRTYDATHWHVVGAMEVGRVSARDIEDWTTPYKLGSYRNNLTRNLLLNPAFGGTDGTQVSVPVTNSAVPAKWSAQRFGTEIEFGMFKSRRTANKFVSGTTYPIGARIKPVYRNGFHYLVLSSAAATIEPWRVSTFSLTTTTTGAVAADAFVVPVTSATGVVAGQCAYMTLTNGLIWESRVASVSGSNITMAGRAPSGVSSGGAVTFDNPVSVPVGEVIRPGGSGPFYKVVAENDTNGPQDPGEDLLLEVSSTVEAADRSITLRQDVDVSAYVGRSMRASIMVEHLDGYDNNAYHLRIMQTATAGSTVIANHVGMGVNRKNGDSTSPTLIVNPKGKLWVPTFDFTILPGIGNVRFAFYAFPRASSSAGKRQGLLLSDPVLELV